MKMQVIAILGLPHISPLNSFGIETVCNLLIYVYYGRLSWAVELLRMRGSVCVYSAFGLWMSELNDFDNCSICRHSKTRGL